MAARAGRRCGPPARDSRVRTVGDDLDWLRARLPNEDIWPRTELLNWWNDAYREFLTRSRATRRLRPLELPGFHTYAVTQEWEDRHTQGGTFRKPSRAAAAAFYQSSGLWEIESMGGVTPSQALAGFTQEWERAHLAGATDHHFRFMFPKDHERVVHLSWKDRALTPISVRELDSTDTAWMAQLGEPRWWTSGVGRIRTVEIYEVPTTYQQGYAQGLEGVPRQITGTRVYEPITDRMQTNAWAYTNLGEAEAFTTRTASFEPATTYTQTWEQQYGRGPRFNFTINLTMNYPGLGYTAVHPWELAQVGGPWLGIDEPALILDPLVYPGSDTPVPLDGLARLITVDGDTGEGIASCFPWEEAFGGDAIDIPTGTVRGLDSPDRQYLVTDADAQTIALSGRLAEWRSSESAVMAIEVITAAQALAEADIPALIPRQMMKYLRYYVLARAFARTGEGRQPVLADHFGRRFLAGVAFFRRFTDLAQFDRVFTREEDESAPTLTPPRVRFPSNFPAVG